MGFHIATCVRVDHGPQNYKCSLVGFLFEKICKAIPKSSQRRGKEKQRPWQSPGDWILEQRGKEYRVWPVQLNNYFIFVSASAAEGSATGASQEDQLHQGLAPKRLWKNGEIV